MKPSEIREKTAEELTKKAGELKEEIFRLRFRSNINQLQQTANIKKARKDLARIETVKREREIEQAKGGK